MNIKNLLFTLFFALFSLASFADTKVLMTTSLGEIELVLDEQKAPKTVANFLHYVKKGFYNHTIFHRVIDGFMIQGGGFTKNMLQKPTESPIANEANNGLKNQAGTIAMARTADPHSATSQFFINLVDNPALDFTSTTTQGYGYTVFGRVTRGMEVVQKIAKVRTTYRFMHQDVPEQPILIISIKVKN